ncbi:MAG: GntR family transcriptional regulator [Deltaproteobacteria bacterium]|nr:GntR family transcriptional regulator [Deltaproteobacteria bacterium]
MLLERYPTLRERIVDSIKEAVIKGSLKPGERVPEPELAERFGISRTPIREAFRQLEIEGFITVTPRKGAIVSPITDKDVRDFYGIKGVLEGYAAKTSCHKLTEKDLQKMEHLNELMMRCAEKNDAKTFSKIDNQFHDVFLKAGGNEKLWKLLHNLVQQFERFRMASISLPGRMKGSIKQHGDIINAFRRKDVDLVERLVKLNAEKGAELLVKEILKER